MKTSDFLIINTNNLNVNKNTHKFDFLAVFLTFCLNNVDLFFEIIKKHHFSFYNQIILEKKVTLRLSKTVS